MLFYKQNNPEESYPKVFNWAKTGCSKFYPKNVMFQVITYEWDVPSSCPTTGFSKLLLKNGMFQVLAQQWDFPSYYLRTGCSKLFPINGIFQVIAKYP